MPSQKTSPAARTPQRKRGHERVASLLAAAAECFVDKGYDAATMTEIAARAGASIGSLYQFFPTKESLALAMVVEHAQALYARIAQLAPRAGDWDNEELAGQFIRLFVDFRGQHPVFAVLTEMAPSIPQDDALTIRMRVRDELTQVMAARYPALPSSQAHAAATVVQYMMKAAVALHAETNSPTRTAAQRQLQHALRLYLDDLAHG